MPDEPKVEPEGTEKPRDYESEIKGLRSEAAGYRVERNELKKQVEALSEAQKKRDDAEKSEVEKLTEGKAAAEKALADKEREIGEAQTRFRIMSAAQKAGVVDPELAYKALDLADIDPEDPKTIKKALENLLKDKPFLVASQPPSPGTGGPPIAGKPSADQMLLRMMKK